MNNTDGSDEKPAKQQSVLERVKNKKNQAAKQAHKAVTDVAKAVPQMPSQAPNMPVQIRAAPKKLGGASMHEKLNIQNNERFMQVVSIFHSEFWSQERLNLEFIFLKC